MADSITSRSSPSPTRRAYHSSAGAAASRNTASSTWVRGALLRRRSRTVRSRSYTAPAAAPSAAAVTYPSSWVDTIVPISAEQPPEQPAAPVLRRVLIAQRVNAPVHVQLTAV